MNTGDAERLGARTRGPAQTEIILGAKGTGAAFEEGNVLTSFLRSQYRKLLGLRARLVAERETHALAARQALERFSMDMADTATDAVDHDLVLGELSAEQDELYEIDEALKRIANGTYGICEVTRLPIPRARLRALPWTRFSRQVEQKLESSGAAARPRLGQLRSVTGPARQLPQVAEMGGEPVEEVASDEALYQSPQIPGALWSRQGRRKMAPAGRRAVDAASSRGKPKKSAALQNRTVRGAALGPKGRTKPVRGQTVRRGAAPKGLRGGP